MLGIDLVVKGAYQCSDHIGAQGLDLVVHQHHQYDKACTHIYRQGGRGCMYHNNTSVSKWVA